MSNIQGDNYRVWYEETNKTVHFEGTLRLGTVAEYSPIIQLLSNIANSPINLVNLNFKSLYALNSSGISMLSKFIIDIRDKSKLQVIVKASNNIPWQPKSLKNLQRLMPNIILKYE
ncbi:hypothetical protein DSM106972_020150 [Dulcicalothrix desertica PCC 7102]|uniref:STAS domain-containing protein n=1 Tax=Dulcicalothrix desertica PCC 7102 TaxID=232991 RepID=A0A433VNZ6_9CYAN|nr:hypothetical protein [Dulcicalothrix desertica]RUT07755.1 hypothetical protein DSM106972_020150 [Dulcicalothrix desertica PCC 7102]TWH39288.1 hypothetical protein CAL7102_08507 [Dulcicalothrix desertica PCC 7102]